MQKWTFLLLITVLTGCANQNNDSRYTQKEDSAPSQPLPVAHLDDASPKYEPPSRWGNRNYTVRGKHYVVIQGNVPFTQQGTASWYGNKFHGHQTANGEIYDMYSMTAAHKTLPLPSYVKVTNQSNGLSVVVRVNDRGPFHGDRIIDLSYAAAKKIGITGTGTAKVTLERIVVPKPNAPSFSSENVTTAYFVQIGSFSEKRNAEALWQSLPPLQRQQARIHLENRHYKVQIGPYFDTNKAQKQVQQWQQNHPSAFLIANPS